jgi:uncharacterized protein (DUF1697 family)
VTNRVVALLRGVNVGTAKRIAMADLRALVEGLGYGDVRTLLNSGNVVFTAPKKSPGDAAQRIEQAIATRLGVTTRVMLLSGRELSEAVRGNPLRAIADDPSRLLFMVFRDAKAMTPLRPLLEEPWAPETLALGRRVAYVWCANGLMESRLWKQVDRAARDAATARNMTTMTKLLALVEDA